MSEMPPELEGLLIKNKPSKVEERSFAINTQGGYNEPRLDTGLPNPDSWVKVSVTDNCFWVRGGEKAFYKSVDDGTGRPIWKEFPQTDEKVQQPKVQLPHDARVFILDNGKTTGQIVQLKAEHTPSNDLGPDRYNGTTVTITTSNHQISALPR